MEYIKNFCFYFILAIIITLGSNYLKSDFIFNFLDANLVVILIALLAINLTTCSVIMTKLKEISDKKNIDFTKTVIELKKSIYEQIILICLSVIFQILKHSVIIGSKLKYHQIIFDSLIVMLFIYSVYILYDTGKAIFVILEYENESN